MKLGDYARETGLSYRTVLRMFHRGDIPGRQLPTGTIIVDAPPQQPNNTVNRKVSRAVCYARVSNSVNKDNMDRQADRLEAFCAANGFVVVRIVKEVGSGLNDTRPKLLGLLEDRSYDLLVVEHKDRLTRFGFRYIETCLRLTERSVLVINEATGDGDDLMEDFVAVVTSFCSRLYGQRRSHRKIERLVAELQNEDGET